MRGDLKMRDCEGCGKQDREVSFGYAWHRKRIFVYLYICVNDRLTDKPIGTGSSSQKPFKYISRIIRNELKVHTQIPFQWKMT